MKTMINNHHISNEEFEKNQDDLLKYYTDTYLWPLPSKKRGFHETREGIELIVRPQCNQKCEYCYITQYGKELYPIQLNKKDTLKNIDLFFDFFFLQRKNYTREIELFAGDLFYDDIFFDILDLLEKYFIIIKKEDPDIFELPTVISIPSNLAFVYNYPEKAEKVLKRAKEFREKYFTRLLFSWSTDGLYCIEGRENKKLSQEYFDTIFKFCKKIGCGFHPMISASNVKYWKENYQWWLDMYKKFDLSSGTNDFQPMMLEVRNNDWTEENIKDYEDFLSFLMEKRFEMCEKSVKNLTYHLFGIEEDYDNDEYAFRVSQTMNYDPLTLYFNNDTIFNESMGCGLQKMIHINCTNLSLVLCHRLTYNLFTGGYFKLNENNEHIIGLKSHNVPAYITLRNIKFSHFPICFSCKYKSFCMKGCYGAQYEASGEVLLPAENVCKMFKRKIQKQIKLLNEYGVIGYAIYHNLLKDDKINSILQILNEELGMEVKEWIPEKE